MKKDVALVDNRTARDLKEIRWTTLVEVLREEITHLKQHNEDLILREEARQTIFDDFKNERLELKRERKLWVQEPDGTLERERNELKKKRELLMERERKMLERERQLAALQAKMEKERTPWHELVMSYCPLFLRRFLQEQTPSSSLSPLSSSD